MSGLLSLRTPKLPSQEKPQPQIEAINNSQETSPEPFKSQLQGEVERNEEEEIQEGVACIPCTNSHLLTCRGLLDEAHRMSHDGLTPDGLARVDQCLGEIAAAERIDLAPVNIAKLPEVPKKIAHYAAKEIRNIRHDLEGLNSPEVLEQAAAKTAALQQYVTREFMKYRIQQMTPEERSELKVRMEQKLREQQQEAS